MTTPRLPTDQRRAQLADAALSILHTDGARAVTVANIAKRVGITSGAVFRHFPNTQALFDAAVERFEGALPPLPPKTLAPRERLERFFVERVRAVQTQPEILGLTLSDRLETLLSESGAARLQKVMSHSSRFLMRSITEAQKAKLIDNKVTVQTVVWMLTGAMRGAAKSGMKAEKAWSDVDRLLFGGKTK